MESYIPILLFIVIAILVSISMLLLPKFLAKKINNQDSKYESYECGFDQMSNTKGKFDIKFYLLSVLFVLFDIEMIFLIPFAANLKKISLFGFCSCMFFLFILGVGFIYEKLIGALDF